MYLTARIGEIIERFIGGSISSAGGLCSDSVVMMECTR
jgi:hypothetical protein